jgi:hypothetical protein
VPSEPPTPSISPSTTKHLEEGDNGRAWCGFRIRTMEAQASSIHDCDCVDCLGAIEDLGRAAYKRWLVVAGFTGLENT